MAITNTAILIKRSSSTTNPGTLKSGELAYSYVSNTLYFGTVGGNGTINIGGQYYTSQIDNASSANGSATIVKRDASGNASFNYIFGNIVGNFSGTANVATYLQYPQNFSISGGDITASAVAFGGNNAVILSASLNSVAGLSAGTYGSTTAIPVIGLSANGRVTSISTASISTSFNISDGTTSNTINAGATFYHQGAGGITTTVSGNTVTIGTNNTILRANTASAGQQTVSTDLTIAGNLIVTGTQTIINAITVATNDSLIKLAANNIVNDVVDIGFYGQSNTGSSVAYHGLIREGSGGTSAGNFYLFKNLATDPTGNTVNYASLTKGTLIADLSGSTGLPISTGVSGLASGAATFLATPSSANFASLVTDETGTGLVVFNNTPTLVTPIIGAATGTSLNVTSGLVTSGAWGGTFSDGIVVDYVTGLGRISVGGQDGIQFYANTETTRTPLLTIAANTALSNAIWQGSTIGVPYGGTGVTSFTLDGIVYGNGSGALQATAAAGTSDQTWSNQIMTVNNSGVPVWSSALDGGTF